MSRFALLERAGAFGQELPDPARATSAAAWSASRRASAADGRARGEAPPWSRSTRARVHAASLSPSSCAARGEASEDSSDLHLLQRLEKRTQAPASTPGCPRPSRRRHAFEPGLRLGASAPRVLGAPRLRMGAWGYPRAAAARIGLQPRLPARRDRVAARAGCVRDHHRLGHRPARPSPGARARRPPRGAGSRPRGEQLVVARLECRLRLGASGAARPRDLRAAHVYGLAARRLRGGGAPSSAASTATSASRCASLAPGRVKKTARARGELRRLLLLRAAYPLPQRASGPSASDLRFRRRRRRVGATAAEHPALANASAPAPAAEPVPPPPPPPPPLSSLYMSRCCTNAAPPAASAPRSPRVCRTLARTTSRASSMLLAICRARWSRTADAGRSRPSKTRARGRAARAPRVACSNRRRARRCGVPPRAPAAARRTGRSPPQVSFCRRGLARRRRRRTRARPPILVLAVASWVLVTLSAVRSTRRASCVVLALARVREQAGAGAGERAGCAARCHRRPPPPPVRAAAAAGLGEALGQRRGAHRRPPALAPDVAAAGAPACRRRRRRRGRCGRLALARRARARARARRRQLVGGRRRAPHRPPQALVLRLDLPRCAAMDAFAIGGDDDGRRARLVRPLDRRIHVRRCTRGVALPRRRDHIGEITQLRVIRVVAPRPHTTVDDRLQRPATPRARSTALARIA